MDRSYGLLELKDDEGIRMVMGENFERSDASMLMNKFAKTFDIGDIVFAHSNDLVEIVECRSGKFGYTVYKIKYLSRPPIAEHPEDWIEGRRLTLIIKPKDVRPFYEKNLEPSSTIPEVAKEALRLMLAEDDVTIVSLMKKTLTEFHEKGLLTMMLFHSNIIRPIGKKKVIETPPESP